MEDDLKRRMRALTMSMSYQEWKDSFANPINYRPHLFARLGVEDDFTLTFGYRGSSVKVPLTFFCALSPKLHIKLMTKPRRGLSVCLKDEAAYPYWWLRNFLEHKTQLPGAEGTVLVLLMAHQYDLPGVVSMCRDKLYFYLSIENFPFIYNCAVLTDDDGLLEECNHMIEAWSDELLVLPSLSALERNCMLSLLSHHKLSPSSELNVFNAIINWWRSRGSRCYNDLCFLDDLRTCLDQVRYLLLSEQELKCQVLPSCVFPFEDVQVMVQMLRGVRARDRGLAYLIRNPELQATPRPKLVKVAHLGVQREDDVPELKLSFRNNIDERGIAWFTADKLCYVRRISSASILDEGGGTLTVTNKGMFLMTQRWKRYSCTFEQPLPLVPHMLYEFVYKSAAGLTDEECSESMKKKVAGVTFEGLRYCESLTIEFCTDYVESDSEPESSGSGSENSAGSGSENSAGSGSEASGSENSAATSSSDGADSLEVIHKAEVLDAEIQEAEARLAKL